MGEANRRKAAGNVGDNHKLIIQVFDGSTMKVSSYTVVLKPNCSVLEFVNDLCDGALTLFDIVVCQDKRDNKTYIVGGGNLYIGVNMSDAMVKEHTSKIIVANLKVQGKEVIYTTVSDNGGN